MTDRRDPTLGLPGRVLDVFSADGTRLNVEVYHRGQDAAPTVVLVHGWTCSLLFWVRQVESLVAGGVRVVVYDQRGHGTSAVAGPAGYTPDALADDLLAVLTATLDGDAKAVLGGHSMGAMSMIALGARHPLELRRRVAAALLASTGVHELAIRHRIVPLPLPLARLARPIAARMFAWTPAGARSTWRQRFITRYASLSSSATEAEVDFCLQLVNACPPAGRAGFARMLSELDLDREVTRFDVPSVVLAGTHDRLTPIWHARRLATTLPRLLDTVELAGVGHMTPVQAAPAVTAALRRLVTDFLPAAGAAGRTQEIA